MWHVQLVRRDLFSIAFSLSRSLLCLGFFTFGPAPCRGEEARLRELATGGKREIETELEMIYIYIYTCMLLLLTRSY